MSYVHLLIVEYMQHPFAYTMGGLTTIAALLKKFAPQLRITKALNALASDVPELSAIALSLASKKSLLKALELGGHVINDVAVAIEEPVIDLKQKKVVPVPVKKSTVNVDEIKTTLEKLLKTLNETK